MPAEHGPRMLNSSKVHCLLCVRKRYTLGSLYPAGSHGATSHFGLKSLSDSTVVVAMTAFLTSGPSSTDGSADSINALLSGAHLEV